MTKTSLKPAMQHEKDAITLLTEDYKKVKKLFADFTKVAKSDGIDKEKEIVLLWLSCGFVNASADITKTVAGHAEA